jgi:hypothetical protein
VGLVVVIVAAVAVPSHMRLVRATLGPRGFVRLSAASMSMALAATALAAAVPLAWGRRELERAEF